MIRKRRLRTKKPYFKNWIFKDYGKNHGSCHNFEKYEIEKYEKDPKDDNYDEDDCVMNNMNKAVHGFKESRKTYFNFEKMETICRWCNVISHNSAEMTEIKNTDRFESNRETLRH